MRCHKHSNVADEKKLKELERANLHQAILLLNPLAKILGRFDRCI